MREDLSFIAAISRAVASPHYMELKIMLLNSINLYGPMHLP